VPFRRLHVRAWEFSLCLQQTPNCSHSSGKSVKWWQWQNGWLDSMFFLGEAISFIDVACYIFKFSRLFLLTFSARTNRQRAQPSDGQQSGKTSGKSIFRPTQLLIFWQWCRLGPAWALLFTLSSITEKGCSVSSPPLSKINQEQLYIYI